MKTAESNLVELRFLIPSKIAGIVIGKSGENVKNLRKLYPVRITISENPGPERVLTLEGDICPSMTVLESILDRIFNLNDNSIDLRLLVHNSQAGIIIGKAGSKIREFREKSRLKSLKVYQTHCPSSTDRVVQIVGERPNVVGFVESVAEMLKTSVPKGMVENYDAGNFAEASSADYGGWGSYIPASGGRRMKSDNDSSGQYSYYMPNKNNMSQSSLTGTTAAMINDVLAGRIHTNNSGTGNGHSGPGGDATAAAMMAAGMMRGLPNRIGLTLNLTPTTTTQVSISDKMIGAIMGKGGTRINQVRRESGADIKISQHEAGVEDRIITITGTPDQIQNAQFLLQVCVKKYGDQM